MPRAKPPPRDLPFVVRKTPEGWLALDPPPPPELLATSGSFGRNRCWKQGVFVPTRLLTRRTYDATLDGPITKRFPKLAGRPDEVTRIVFHETGCPRCGHRVRSLDHPSEFLER
jgi:hypothetical protein